jgi:hypothetical protein
MQDRNGKKIWRRRWRWRWRWRGSMYVTADHASLSWRFPIQVL